MFCVIDVNCVVYFDLIGSGIEMIVYFCENGRIVLMFCVFLGVVRILWIYGKG